MLLEGKAVSVTASFPGYPSVEFLVKVNSNSTVNST